MAELKLIECRLIGDEAEIRTALERIGWVVNVSWDEGVRPTRYGNGVRAYAELQVPSLEDLDRTTSFGDDGPDRPRPPRT
ncbi:hypothetical protein [Amycolatopsis rubida]|uniref:Uncharacterized protein n=1 Tax=Amycolatopsis rubida TaxID=112413 RepID=A0A1I5X7U3_9PSEU|nr:hypothetical protein [Amycolatopsis rubida]SFQ28040.1 hypothetical protein SAMN05421854_11085 [Amycolatopsis rubida]